MVALKNCEPELSYILAELFSICLKESCFPNSWKVPLLVPVLKNVGERSTAINYLPVSLLSVLSKFFEKFLISTMVLSLRGQLQIFWQLYLIELVGLLTGLGLLEL